MGSISQIIFIYYVLDAEDPMRGTGYASVTVVAAALIGSLAALVIAYVSLLLSSILRSRGASHLVATSIPTIMAFILVALFHSWGYGFLDNHDFAGILISSVFGIIAAAVAGSTLYRKTRV